MGRPARSAVAAAALLLGGATGALAARGPMPPPTPAAPAALPPAGLAGDGFAEAARARWLVAARRGPRAAALARAAGARRLGAPFPLWSATRPTAARLARRLRAEGLLWYAEPDAAQADDGLPQDPLSGQMWWAPVLVPDPLAPPPAGGPPAIGVGEVGVDTSHPDLAGTVALSGTPSPDNRHGTAVASVAVAPANGVGITGIWPGATAVAYVRPNRTCAESTEAVMRAARDRIPVYNMSYGFRPATACYSHFVATQFAFGNGVALVASAGNAFEQGNPPGRPATDPHVLTIAAVDASLGSAPFSNEGVYVDLSGPGVDVPIAVPLPLDTRDGVRDGWTRGRGTSYAAPIVAGALAWLRRARPDLTPGQAGDQLRFTARDIGPEGFDQTFGYGLPDLTRALAEAPPPDDPLEPNDDIEWVDGEHFPPDPIALRASQRITWLARLDTTEDPFDVRGVWLPPRTRVVVDAVPSEGGISLEAYRTGAETVQRDDSPGLVASSYRPGTGAERMVVQNPDRRAARRVWVSVYPDGDVALSATYRVTMRRSRLP